VLCLCFVYLYLYECVYVCVCVCVCTSVLLCVYNVCIPVCLYECIGANIHTDQAKSIYELMMVPQTPFVELKKNKVRLSKKEMVLDFFLSQNGAGEEEFDRYLRGVAEEGVCVCVCV